MGLLINNLHINFVSFVITLITIRASYTRSKQQQQQQQHQKQSQRQEKQQRQQLQLQCHLAIK